MTDDQGVQSAQQGAPPPPPVDVPADWYPDPDARDTQLRYWDGERWTDHYAPSTPAAAPAQADPAPAAAQHAPPVELDATAEEGHSQAAPGWYVDPHDATARRYWDGSKWSDWTDRNYSSKALGGKENPKNDTLAVVGWITAVFLPIVGLVIGAILNNRDDQRGTWIMITAAVFIVLGLLLVAI